MNMTIFCGIIMDDGSDHFPIFCMSELNVEKPLKIIMILFIEKTLMIKMKMRDS